MIGLQAPPATSDTEALADWIEVWATIDSDRRCSREDLVSALRISGSTDAFEDVGPDGDFGSEIAQALAESAMEIVENRESILGSSYPFSVTSGSVLASEDPSDAARVYKFLLLSSCLSGELGSSNSVYTRLFEDVCAVAACEYFGGVGRAEVYQMGHPRRSGQPSKFIEAVTEMCSLMFDGGAARPRLKASDMKDAKLDIAAWIPSPDRRQGKVIGFGQCATGKNWRDKVSELQPESWAAMWVSERFAVLPVRMFFVPHMISTLDWLYVSFEAGVVFDRVRIVANMTGVSAGVLASVDSWVSTAISNVEA